MHIINGFKVIGDTWVNENNCYKCNALCKECGREFVTNYHSLERMKSCGCARPKQFKPLPEYINGFRTIKCLGHINGSRRAIVECKECKREYEVDPNKLKYRKHCGCMKKNVIACKYAKSHPQLAQAIKHMMSRCYNNSDKDYYNYGGRGIIVCDEWLKDRNTFCKWALENGFENNKNLSIDRIDSSKGYFPENCRWTNAAIQARNTRRNVMTIDIAREIREKAKTNKYITLAAIYGVSYGTISNIVNFRSWKE